MNDNENDGQGPTPSKVEEEALVGNLNKVMVVPPEHKGRPKQGHLIFNANFESGNLARVDYISECEFDIFIRPDTCNPKQRVWFYFSVENVRCEQRVIFNIVNFSKTRSLYRDGMAPVVKSTSRPKWQRIPPKHVYYYKSPPHNDSYVMSFAFAFDRVDETYFFAYCFPYTYSMLQSYLSDLESRKLPYFHRDLLGSSLQQRRLDLLTITDPANLSVSNRQRIVFITARVHPGETVASFVCQGLIDFLVSSHQMAVRLREHFVFKIVPMLNPDGVFLGNYRCSLMGFDLNRHWQTPSPWAQPTIFATKNLLVQYNQNPKIQLDFFIDLHGHSQQLNAFFYGNCFTNDASRCERQLILPTLLDEIAEDYSLDQTQFNMDPCKAGAARRAMGGTLDVQSMCYTLEVSIFGFVKKDNPSDIIPYTEESYKKLGEHIGQAFYQYLEVEQMTRTVQTRPFHTFATNFLNKTFSIGEKKAAKKSGKKSSSPKNGKSQTPTTTTTTEV